EQMQLASAVEEYSVEPESAFASRQCEEPVWLAPGGPVIGGIARADLLLSGNQSNPHGHESAIGQRDWLAQHFEAGYFPRLRRSRRNKNAESGRADQPRSGEHAG